jgi:4-amino-4-deoxy-L-arabinose transferase-like glycosyltransferase
MTRVVGSRGIARAGLALLVLIFVGLRLFDLTADPPADLDGSGGIYFDEGMLAQGARNKLLFGSFFQDDWNDVYITPLLSLLKLAVLSVTGVGLLQVRIIAVAFGLGSLLLFYLILRRGAGRETALLGVALLGCNHIYGMFNRIGLTETPVCFFMLLAGWLWQEGVLRRRAPWFFFGAGAVAFVAYTVKAFPYFIPAVALAGVLAWWLLPAEERSLRRPGALREVVLAAAAFVAGIVLPLAVWYFAFYRRFAASIEQASAFYRSQQIPRSAGALLKDLIGVPFFRYFTETPVLLVFSVLFIGLGILLWFHRRGRLLPLDLFFACWFVAHFAMFAALQYRPVRYYLPIVPPMAAMAARAMVLLGRRTGLRLPERLAPAALALLFPWLAVSIYYGLPEKLALAGSWLARTPPEITPGRLAIGAVAGSLVALALAAVLAKRLGGRTIPLPPRAAAIACIMLPAALSLGIDARNWQQWAATRRHVIRDTSREFGAAIPDAYIAGLGATTISLENRNRAIHAHERFFNGNDTFARFPLTHLFMGGRNREVEFWYRRYPAEMKSARVVRAIAVKKDHYYLYSLVDPTVEAVAAADNAGSAAGGTVATVTVRNNDPRYARDIGGALLLHPIDGSSDVVIPASSARAVPAGQRVDLGVPGPLPPGSWRLLAFVPPALEHRFEAEYLTHRTGRLVREERASNSEVWEAAAPGIAISGPNLRYPPGLLRASFRLRVEGPAGGSVAILRVTADRGRAVLAERRVEAAEIGTAKAFADIALPEVALEQEQALEFTAETVGGAKVEFDLVRVAYTSGVWWREPILVGADAPTRN